MILNLEINERLVVSSLYPEKSNIITQTLVRDITNKVRLEQPEMEEIGMTFNQDTHEYHWKEEDTKPIDVDFTSKEISFLQNKVDELDKKNNIKQQMLTLCLKIREAK